MKKNKNIRNWRLNIRLNEEELKTITGHFAKTTSTQIRAYARNILLQKPVVVKHRNKSADDAMAELIILRKELNFIGNNFNQAVKKLHTYNTVPDFKFWLVSYEELHRKLLQEVETVNEFILQFSRKW